MRKRVSQFFLIAILCSLVTGCQSRPSFNFGSYSEAERLYEKKQYEKAIAKYEQYLRENREGNMAAIAYYYMAKSHEALKHADESRNLYQKVVQDFPKTIWANFSKTRLQELASESRSSS